LAVVAIFIGNVLPLLQATDMSILVESNRIMIEISEQITSLQENQSGTYYKEVNSHLDEIRVLLALIHANENSAQIDAFHASIVELLAFLNELLLNCSFGIFMNPT